MTEVMVEKKMKKDPGYGDLCAAVLLNIASFAIGDTSRDLDDRCLEQSPADEFDSENDRPETYSDIEQSSDEDRRNVDVNDGMAFDDWMDRRYEREGERHSRRERAQDKLERCRDWCQKLKLDLSKTKQDALSIINMMGVCKQWRKELSLGGDSYANKYLWKALVRNLFPLSPGGGGLCMDNILEKRGYSFFSIFQLMVKISLAKDASDSHRDKKQKRAQTALEEVDLEEVVIFMEFQYNSRYGAKSYTGFGGMDNDRILRVNVPRFGDVVEKKRRKWSKDAADCFERVLKSGSRRYENEWTDSSERSCIFPLASIFVIVPSKKSSADLPLDFSVFKIYSGKPKWRRLNNDNDSYGEAAGEVIADLFGNNYLTAYGNIVTVLYDSENGCHGAYSDWQKEYILENKEEYYLEDDDSDDAMFTRLREEDVKGFLLGSGVQYTKDAPYHESDCESDCDY